MSLTQFGVDDGPHNTDGLRLCARDCSERVEAFIGPNLSSTGEDGKACSVINTMRLAS
jgi:hypothetical protein